MSNIHEQYVYDPRYWMVGDSPNAIRATGKYPVIAEQHWKSRQDAIDYINDPDSSAIPGSILMVLNDEEPSENGVYFVEKIGVVSPTGEIQEGKLSKIGGPDMDDTIAEHLKNSELIHKAIFEGVQGIQTQHEQDVTFGDGIDDDWETVKVGGINEKTRGETLKGKSVKEVLNDILFPTLYPTATQPSVSITYNGTTVFEVNGVNRLPEESAFTTVPNRGTLTYNNADGNKFYAGVATIEKPTIDKDGFGAIVGEKEYTVTCKAKFAEGAQPLNNKGTTEGVDVVKCAATEKTATKKLYGVYPIYVNNKDITKVDRLGIYNYIGGSVSFEVTIPQEIASNKFEIHVPEGLTFSVLQKNPANGKYEGKTEMKFTETTDEHGSGKTYNKYVRNDTTNAGPSEYQITINKK